MYTGICLLHVFLGPLPKWFDLFVISCRYNLPISFIIFSESFTRPSTQENVSFIPFSKKKFIDSASNKLNCSVQLEIPRKICDFKPAFGKIFEDYLKPYKFWGYCDNDLILGKIQDFLTPEIMERYDVISTYKGFMSGPFSLYRNNLYINNLYSHSSDYLQIFNSPGECVGYDENIGQKVKRRF